MLCNSASRSGFRAIRRELEHTALRQVAVDRLGHLVAAAGVEHQKPIALRHAAEVVEPAVIRFLGS